MGSCFSLTSLFALQARVFALSGSPAFHATTMPRGSVAAAELARSSWAKFFPKSKDKIPVLHGLNLASGFNVERACQDATLRVLLAEVKRLALLAHPPPTCWRYCRCSCLPRPGLSKMSQVPAAVFNNRVALTAVC